MKSGRGGSEKRDFFLNASGSKGRLWKRPGTTVTTAKSEKPEKTRVKHIDQRFYGRLKGGKEVGRVPAAVV